MVSDPEKVCSLSLDMSWSQPLSAQIHWPVPISEKNRSTTFEIAKIRVQFNVQSIEMMSKSPNQKSLSKILVGPHYLMWKQFIPNRPPISALLRAVSAGLFEQTVYADIKKHQLLQVDMPAILPLATVATSMKTKHVLASTIWIFCRVKKYLIVPKEDCCASSKQLNLWKSLQSYQPGSLPVACAWWKIIVFNSG